MVHPPEQKRLFAAAFLDALSTCVFDAIGRLVKQQRLFRMGPIHEFRQRIPKASITCSDTPSGGKCSRVAEATPSA